MDKIKLELIRKKLKEIQVLLLQEDFKSALGEVNELLDITLI